MYINVIFATILQQKYSISSNFSFVQTRTKFDLLQNHERIYASSKSSINSKFEK